MNIHIIIAVIDNDANPTTVMRGGGLSIRLHFQICRTIGNIFRDWVFTRKAINDDDGDVGVAKVAVAIVVELFWCDGACSFT